MIVRWCLVALYFHESDDASISGKNGSGDQKRFFKGKHEFHKTRLLKKKGLNFFLIEQVSASWNLLLILFVAKETISLEFSEE